MLALRIWFLAMALAGIGGREALELLVCAHRAGYSGAVVNLIRPVFSMDTSAPGHPLISPPFLYKTRPTAPSNARYQRELVRAVRSNSQKKVEKMLGVGMRVCPLYFVLS